MAHYNIVLLTYLLTVCSTSIFVTEVEQAMVRKYTKNTARLMLPKIIFLTESLMFGIVFPHALFLPPV